MKKVLLIFVRYLSLLFAIISIFACNKNSAGINIYIFVILLIFIINNQLRFFTFNKNKYFMVISFAVELSLSGIIFKFYGGNLFLITFCILIDLSMIIKNGFIEFAVISFFCIIIFMAKDNNIILLMPDILSVITIGSLSFSIGGEIKRKVEAQNLYDKLRMSEEELKEAKQKLEVYASTVEEITILRERNRISREIHDSVGHSLSTMIIQLSAISKVAEKDGMKASLMADNLNKFARKALKDVRAAVNALKPMEFEKYQGIAAVQEMIKNFKKLTGVEVIFTVSKNVWPLNSDQSFVIYRVVQEFLTNAVRHGKASNININLNFFEDYMYMYLKDNGIGCSHIEEGMGLKNINERVSSLGGNVHYNSSENKGFEADVNLPKIEALIKE